MRLSDCPGSPKTLKGSCKSFRTIVYSIQPIFTRSDPAIESLTLRQLDASCHRYILSPALLRAKRYADALSLSQDWFDPQYRAHRDYYHPPRGGCAFHPPSPEPMTQEHMEGYALPGLPATILLLNAAYATFRLWGDTELARQYLRMGARANPRIFVKILAGREKPSASPSENSQVVSRVTNLLSDGPCSQPTGNDDADEAREYLWLSQDFWTEPDVWEWLKANQDVQDVVAKTCARHECGVREARPLDFKRCARCRTVFYCSPECQRADWPSHKRGGSPYRL